MSTKSELVKLFQDYLDDARELQESDGFLPGLDVTEIAAVELLNDIIKYHVTAGTVQNDTNEQVKEA